ncbi:MAG: ABC transporter permease [Acidimicrobiales bacterium]
MQRLCERPGCGAASDASYGIDRQNLVVWVDRPDIAERETAGRLCRRHANALMVPRGWTLDDRREPVPRLFKVKDADEPVTPAKKTAGGSGRRGAGRRAKEAADTPSLFEAIRREINGDAPPRETGPAANDGTVPDGTAPVEAVDPDETQAMPWSPRLGRAAPDDGQPKPTFGRLLGRAFGEPPPVGDDE